MSKNEMMVLGLSGIAVYLILQSTGMFKGGLSMATLKATAQRYNTNPTSQQTQMLAEQDAWFNF
jgi:hypothetical protein